MQQAFVIMQIGNPELDNFYENILVPTLMDCNLNVKRVDKHNEGNLLKSEIVNFIKSSDIILADLTNERPNCYLEVGYAMGLEKFQNLILIVREDHRTESPNYKKNGPKIHFDLLGYDIIFWDPNNIDEFKNKLKKQINRRLNLIKQEAEIKEIEINFIDKVKEHIKNDEYIDFHDMLKEQIKIIENQWFEMYEEINSEFEEKNDNDIIIKGLKDFEIYTDRLIPVGLSLVEYSHEYIDEFLKIIQQIYDLPDTLFEDKYNIAYKPRIKDLPRAALYGIYCSLGACAIKNEKLDILGKLVKLEISEKNFSLPMKPFIWFNSDIFYPKVFSDEDKDVFKFLYDSYDYKDFLGEFFRSKQEFLKYLCQFSLILSLYGAKMQLDTLKRYWIYPKFSNYSFDNDKIMPLLSKIKNEHSFASKFSKEVFGENEDVFMKSYYERCGLINKIIVDSGTSIFKIFTLPCDIFLE